MEFYQLRTFVIVAEEKSITKAARRLYTTPPSVSAHIKALESEFNVRLFERVSNGMQITEKGKILKEKAEQTLLAAQNFVNHAVKMQEQLMGLIHFGINATPSYLRIPQLVNQIKGSSPGINLDLALSSTAKIINDLKRGTMDAGYIFGPEETNDITKRYICSTELVVAAPKKWQSKISNAGWKDIAQLPWIYSSQYCPFQQIIDDLFQQKNMEFNRNICSDDEAIKSELVSSGVGLSLIEKTEAELAVDDSKLCIWKTKRIHCDLFFAYLTKRSGDPLIAVLESNILNVWEINKKV